MSKTTDCPNSLNDVPQILDYCGEKREGFSNKAVDQRRVCSLINPSSAVSANLLANGTIDYRFEDHIDRIASMYLRLKFTVGGSNAVLASPQMWINNIELYGDNGSTLLLQHTNNVETFLLFNSLLSRNEYENVTDLIFSDDVYDNGGNIYNANSQGYVYIPILPQFWRAVKARTYSFDGNLLLRLKFNPEASNVTSGGGANFIINEAILDVVGYEETDAQKNYILERSNIPKAFPYYGIQRHFETQTLNPSQRYNIKLSGLHGDINCLFFAVRQTAYKNDPANQFNFEQIASFDFLSPANISLTGHKIQLKEDMVLTYSQLFNNKFIKHTNAYIWSLSQAPQQDWTTGSCNGFYKTNGFETLQFDTPSTLVAGSFEIMVFGTSVETLDVTNARLTTTRI